MDNKFILEANGESFELTLADFEITTEDIPGWQVANDGPLTVALDITITDALKAEGMARELVNRIQNLRKDKDFNVVDRINIRLQEHEIIQDAIAQFGDYIQDETLGLSLEVAAEVSGDEIELPGEVKLMIAVEKA